MLHIKNVCIKNVTVPYIKRFHARYPTLGTASTNLSPYLVWWGYVPYTCTVPMKNRLFVPVWVPTSGLVPHLVKRESVVSLLTNIQSSVQSRCALSSVFKHTGVVGLSYPREILANFLGCFAEGTLPYRYSLWHVRFVFINMWVAMCIHYVWSLMWSIAYLPISA